MVFSNKFNSKKADPLVEAAKAAMELGQKRRDAINAVNEEFGVYGRNAVVREQLAAYDARIEEVYKGMMAGNLTEGKKLADKDYDHDGKIESPKDEVWGSRLRAAKLAGKLKEGKKAWEEETDYSAPDRAAVTKDNKPVVSTTAPKADTSGPSAADKAGLAAKIKSMKEEKLDEISKEKLGRYIKTAHYRGGMADFRHGMLHNKELTKRKKNPVDQEYMQQLSKKSKKREKGIDMATDKLTGKAKVHAKEALDEAVSRKHFQQVADLIKGHESQEKRNELASHHAGIFAKQNPRFDHGRFHKAAGSTAHEAPKKMEEEKYSFKAARSGEDIGKPGKMFSKIAKKAGKKYGSEERGKKVAGAILAKIRAKHMEEQVSIAPPLPPKRPANLGAPKTSTASKPGIVSKSDLDTYRKNVGNQNATLGQYMNDLKGKTAVTGGKNDPTQIQKTLNKGQKAFDPTERPVSVKGSADYNKALDSSEPNPQGPPQPKSAPEPDNDKLIGSRHQDGAGLDDTKPAASTPSVPAAPASTPAPAPKPDQVDASLKKNSTVAESVMVGTNKYRIV
jgi:hypothetical protein